MRWLAAWFRRRLPRPAPPSAVLLWVGPFPGHVRSPAPLRYDGIDEDGLHVWTALFDESTGKDGYLVHTGSSSPRNRVEAEFLPSAQLARAIAEATAEQAGDADGQ